MVKLVGLNQLKSSLLELRSLISAQRRESEGPIWILFSGERISAKRIYLIHAEASLLGMWWLLLMRIQPLGLGSSFQSFIWSLDWLIRNWEGSGKSRSELNPSGRGRVMLLQETCVIGLFVGVNGGRAGVVTTATPGWAMVTIGGAEPEPLLSWMQDVLERMVGIGW